MGTFRTDKNTALYCAQSAVMNSSAQ
jgi:hypothetical protein